MQIKEFNKDTMVLLPTWSDEKQVFSVGEALAYIGETGKTYHLDNLMFYNVPVRDAIRNNGIGAVASKLLEYSPDNEKIKSVLEKYAKAEIQLADFDIQVLPVTAELRFFGQRICYDYIRRHAEISRRVGRWTSVSEQENNGTLHIGDIFEPYPCFDSFDSGDGDYENYIIRDSNITEEYCMELEKAPHKYDCCYVNEGLPAEYLPMVYRNGFSRFMYVATSKDNPQVTPEELAKKI